MQIRGLEDKTMKQLEADSGNESTLTLLLGWFFTEAIILLALSSFGWRGNYAAVSY
jgi:hypothetical protein